MRTFPLLVNTPVRAESELSTSTATNDLLWLIETPVAVTPPPPVMLRVPVPNFPTRTLPVLLHRDPIPSTFTLPIDKDSAPISPELLLTVPPLQMFIVPSPGLGPPVRALPK